MSAHLDAKTIRQCHEQLKAVAITDPKELREHLTVKLQAAPIVLNDLLWGQIRDLICGHRF